MGLQLSGNSQKKIDWNDLPIGSIFEHYKNIYIKTFPDANERGNKIVAVNLSTGNYLISVPDEFEPLPKGTIFEVE